MKITTVAQADAMLVSYIRTLIDQDNAPAERWDDIEALLVSQIEALQVSGYSEHIDAVDSITENYSSVDYAQLAELLESGNTNASRIASGAALSA